MSTIRHDRHTCVYFHWPCKASREEVPGHPYAGCVLEGLHRGNVYTVAREGSVVASWPWSSQIGWGNCENPRVVRDIAR